MRKITATAIICLALFVCASPASADDILSNIANGLIKYGSWAGTALIICLAASPVIYLDYVNTEGEAELASAHMRSWGGGLSLGVTLEPGPIFLAGLDVRFCAAQPLRNLEFGAGYRLYVYQDLRHDLFLDARYFPFHKLTKGVYFGGGVSLCLYSSLNVLSPAVISNDVLLINVYQPQKFRWNLSTGYRIDLYPVFIQPEARLDGDSSWNLGFSSRLEAGFYL